MGKILETVRLLAMVLIVRPTKTKTFIPRIHEKSSVTFRSGLVTIIRVPVDLLEGL